MNAIDTDIAGKLARLWPHLNERMRRMVAAIGGNEGLEALAARMPKTANNREFLSTLTKDIA